jgi:hypothetical protein
VYRLYDPTRKKIILSRDIIFDETKIRYNHVQNENIVFDNQLIIFFLFLIYFISSNSQLPNLENGRLTKITKQIFISFYFIFIYKKIKKKKKKKKKNNNNNN